LLGPSQNFTESSRLKHGYETQVPDAHYQATYNAYTVRIHLELLSSAVSEQFNNGLSAAI